MKVQLRWFLSLGLTAWLLSTSSACAALVAMEDFDGGAVGLISGFNPAVDNLDGGGGDFFGAGERGAWPQAGNVGMPFGLADDSVISVSNPANPAFPTDNEGLFGQALSMTNAFFGVSDTREWETPDPVTASWTFDIAGFSNLGLSIDLGAHASSSSNGFPTDALLTFTYSIDGGPSSTAFSLAPNPNFGGFSYRAMDNTTVSAVGANGPLEATGASSITKILADTGLPAADTFLNKSPASGQGAGLLDTFVTSLAGTGSQLTLTFSANLDFEAMGFDNIQITGVPEPGSIVLLMLGAAVVSATRSRRQA